MRYTRIYHMLVCHGHSPQHAADILVACRRKDRFSLNWVRRAHQMVPRKLWAKRKQLMERRS